MKIFYDCSREIERWMFHSSFNQIVYIFFPQHTVYNNFSTTHSWIKQILILWPCTNSVHPRILSKAPGTPSPSLPTLGWKWQQKILFSEVYFGKTDIISDLFQSFTVSYCCTWESYLVFLLYSLYAVLPWLIVSWCVLFGTTAWPVT